MTSGAEPTTATTARRTGAPKATVTLRRSSIGRQSGVPATSGGAPPPPTTPLAGAVP